MPSEPIQKLLILQERDRVRMDLEARLEGIPREIETNRTKIAAEQEKVRRAHEEVLKLESRRKALEGELEEWNRKVVRYKNQQLEVKKNEEYQALSHEIETVQERISALEDEEIQVLLDIDEGRKSEEEAERQSRDNISMYEERIAKLEERAERSRTELEDAVERWKEAREGVDGEWRQAYERLREHVRFPVVVPVVEKKCQGCHLKVSAGVESEARRGKEIAACDNCGRLVYFDG